MTKDNNLNYTYVDGDIPLDIPEGVFISITRETPLKIYQLGFQPAKSIPEIPRWFIQRYTASSSYVLEPFAGSGTTIIESIKNDLPIYWLDYHPLSRLICRVKTNEYSSDEIHQEISGVLEKSKRQKHIPQTVNFANKDFWFQKPVQEGLEILKEQILESKSDIQPILWLAFAATVRKTSDMNDGMILAARRSHIQEIPKRSRSDVFSYFQSYASKTIDALDEWGGIANGARKKAVELPLQDARSFESPQKIDVIVTSPPYINAMDYVWASKFELHWLGMVRDDEDRLRLYEKEIGTERIPLCERSELGRTRNSDLDFLIEEIYTGKKYKASKGQNVLRARVTYKYFIDMRDHFERSFNCLKSGGYYCFSIGDISTICGVEIPVAEILTELACELGFKKIFHFHLLLKNRKLNIPRNVNWAGTIKHDTAIVLRKP
jgi:hypothetical protein